MSDSNEINEVWNILITRQEDIIKNRACDEFVHGLQLLELPHHRMPSIKEVSDRLESITGFTLEPVPEIISYDAFFNLLANRKFPCTTFLRTKQQLDYLKEPDVFHEVFGHSPLLTHPAYADFTHNYGKLGLDATEEERVLLARLYWFTIEFGLINTSKGLKAYGGGILSSPKETVFSVESTEPERRPFDVMEALRTPYRIDTIQPIYYVLNNFDQLYDLLDMDLMAMIRQVHTDEKPKHPC